MVFFLFGYDPYRIESRDQRDNVRGRILLCLVGQASSLPCPSLVERRWSLSCLPVCVKASSSRFLLHHYDVGIAGWHPTRVVVHRPKMLNHDPNVFHWKPQTIQSRVQAS